MILLAIALQAAAPTSPPDIALSARVTAREVRIRREGAARLSVHAEPDAGSTTAARTDPPAGGRSRLRNLTATVQAEARIADPQSPQNVEEPTPQR